jgi:GNAT superfamily N-acetyltransferase
MTEAMARPSQATPITVRRYTNADEADVLAVLVASLGAGPAGRRPPEFFRWKHYDNPFGESFVLVAEAEGQIVGVRALMRWRFQTEGVPVSAVRAVDTATHPDWQGRGLFSRLTRDAVEQLRQDTDFIFNTPNDKSLPGYLKMGWRVVDDMRISVNIRRPIRFARSIRSLNGSAAPATPRPAIDALSAADAIELPGVESLLATSMPIGRRLATPKDIAYLRWRYGAAPLLDYRAVTTEREGTITGIAIFRVRERGPLWESSLCELIAAPGDGGTCRSLLRAVAESARVDHISCRFPSGSVQSATALRRGFIPSPGRVTFVANPLRDTLAVDPTASGSWALSLGDLEVF